MTNRVSIQLPSITDNTEFVWIKFLNTFKGIWNSFLNSFLYKYM
ncbi:hypothetical protein C7439_1421 [Lachnoanaerobaculum umeaense]|nr:hypothetical protein C7439_1421 [Lachnoanaerobaculum umeaense]